MVDKGRNEMNTYCYCRFHAHLLNLALKVCDLLTRAVDPLCQATRLVVLLSQQPLVVLNHLRTKAPNIRVCVCVRAMRLLWNTGAVRLNRVLR